MAVHAGREVLDDGWEEVVDQFTPLGRVGHGVAAEVVNVDVRVDAATGAAHVVRVVAKLKQRVGRLGEDGRQAGFFFRFILQPHAVAVLDDPLVVGTWAVVVESGLFFGVAGEVDGGVLHHGVAHAVFSHLRGVLQFFRAQHGAGVHVVAHPQGVSHLVQHQAVQRLTHKLGVLLVGEFVGPHRRGGQQAVASHDRAGVAPVHLLCEDFACRTRFQLSFQLRSFLVHAGFQHAGFGEHVKAPKPAHHASVFKHDVRAQDFTGAWVHEAGAVAREGGRRRCSPTQHVVAHVSRVPVCVVRLHLDDHSILEAEGLKGLVPLLHARLDDGSEFFRCGVFNPPCDGLHRFRHGRGGVLLFEPPAVDHVHPRRGGHARQIFHLGGEKPDAWVVGTRGESVFRHGQQRVAVTHSHVAAVLEFRSAHRGAAVVVDVVHRQLGVHGVVRDVHHLAFGLAQLAQRRFPSRT